MSTYRPSWDLDGDTSELPAVNDHTPAAEQAEVQGNEPAGCHPEAGRRRPFGHSSRLRLAYPIRRRRPG